MSNQSLEACESYRMEWYNDICSQNSFDTYVQELSSSIDNYEQAARLFYTNGAEFVMVELQVPTGEMMKEEPDLMPWLDAYLVKGLDDYDASNEIATTIRCKRVLSFANAEAEMLKFARKQLWDSMKTARSTNELLDYLTKLIEANDERFSFEWATGGENATMEIFDKEKGISYAVNIEPIKYSSLAETAEENTGLTKAEKNDAEARLIKNQDALNNELYENEEEKQGLESQQKMLMHMLEED